VKERKFSSILNQYKIKISFPLKLFIIKIDKESLWSSKTFNIFKRTTKPFSAQRIISNSNKQSLKKKRKILLL
jgi:hypothetical protein